MVQDRMHANSCLRSDDVNYRGKRAQDNLMVLTLHDLLDSFNITSNKT
jgi:hypothetical protein